MKERVFWSIRIRILLLFGMIGGLRISIALKDKIVDGAFIGN